MKLLTNSRYIILAAAIVSLPFTSLPVQASGGLTFSEYAVHPYASKTGYKNGTNGCTQDICPNGQTITDMGITDSGQLIAGYGNWNSNIDSRGDAPGGGVYSIPLNLSDGSWDTANVIRPGSEALDVIREIGGNVYMTQTDPSNIPPTGHPQGTAGYVTSKGGWQFQPLTMADASKPTLEHMFDMASLDNGGDDLWAFGTNCFRWWEGCTSNEALAMRSADGGTTWNFVKTDNSAPEYTDGYERAYWGQAAGGKVYYQALGVTPATPMHIYDSTTDTWTDWKTGDDRVCYTGVGSRVTSYDGKLVCSNSDGYLTYFDGTEPQTARFGDGYVNDLYTARDGYLYILVNGSIYRTNSLTTGTFEKVGTTSGIPGYASTLAVYGDYIYVGGEHGKIYRSTTTIANTPPVVPEITTVSRKDIPLDNSTYTVSVTGKDFEVGAKVTIGGVEMQYSYTSSSLSVKVDTQKIAESLKNQDAQSNQVAQSTKTDTTTKPYRITEMVSTAQSSVTLSLVVTNPSGQLATLASAFNFTFPAQVTPPTTPITPTTPPAPATPPVHSVAPTPTATTKPANKISLNSLSLTGENANIVLQITAALMIAGSLTVATYTLLQRRSLRRKLRMVEDGVT